MRTHIAAILLISLALFGGALLHASNAAAVTNKDAVAVIIGNKDYAGSVPDVDFAHNDAEAMKRFVIDVLGFREGNIIDLRDATQAQMASAFGNERSHEAKLWSWVKQGKSDVVVFYSGHGVPGLNDKRGYLLPVNADPDTPEFNGYPLDLLYANLAKLKARSVTVYLDACFSGESPKGRLTRAASSIGLSHVPEKTDAGITVITAARGDQLASWDESAKHGLFTRYLLDGLYGEADGADYGNEDGEVTLAELQAYLDDEMTYAARRTYLRRQQVTVRGDEGFVLASVPEGDTDEPPTVARGEPVVAVPSILPLDRRMTATKNANVRSGPSTSHDRLQTLRGGEDVDVTGRTADGEWYRIALTAGRVGYVFKNMLAIMEPVPVSILPEPRQSASTSILPEGTAEERYKYAFTLLRKALYAEADKVLSALIEAHPDHPLADNASYWRGEAFYARKMFSDAARIYASNLLLYPEGIKEQDNIVKLGMALTNLGRAKEACQVFAELARKFSKMHVNVRQALARGRIAARCDNNADWMPRTTFIAFLTDIRNSPPMQDRPLARASTMDMALAYKVANLIKSKVENNWSVPAGVRDAEKLIVTIRIRLGRDGAVQSVDILDDNYANDTNFRSMAESARRAVLKASPIIELRRFSDDYDQWRDVTITFRPPA